MRDEEEDVFRKYLARGYSLWGRIKFRLWLLRNNRKVRTFRDVGWGDSQLLMKIFTIILVLMLVRYVGAMLHDIWFWFFPSRVYLSGRWL